MERERERERERKRERGKERPISVLSRSLHDSELVITAPFQLFSAF